MAEWKDTENWSLSICSRFEYTIYYDINFKYGWWQDKEWIAEHAARVTSQTLFFPYDSIIYLPQKRYRKSLKIRSS